MLESFMPHGYCMMWQPRLLQLHVISDAGIVIAYYSIPLALFLLVRRRKDLPFASLFMLFGAFILACGTTHLFSIITVWEPWYWLEGGMKGVTAAVSLATVAVLIPKLPALMALRTPEEVESAQAKLQDQIQRRGALEGQLVSKQEELTNLADRLLTAQEDARRRIARDLHDESGQALSLIQMELTMLLQNNDLPEDQKSLLEDLGERLETLHEGLRHLSHQIHPAIVDITGLRGSINGLCDPVDTCFADMHPEIDALPQALRLDIYRIVQECISNAVKHAEAGSIKVSVHLEADDVLVCVEDDGVGFAPELAEGGLGLVGIRERVIARQGKLKVTSKPGEGAKIVVRLPKTRRALSDSPD